MHTNKNDWLSGIIEASGFVSNDHELTFIKLHDFYCFYMSVNSCDYDRIMEVVNSKLYKLLKTKIDGMFVMGYENNQYKIFKDDGNIMETFNDETLLEFYKDLYPPLVPDNLEKRGSNKEVNETTGGDSHDWNRKNLARAATINDIDALYYHNDSVIFIELKRLKVPLHTWMPYNSDKANYRALEFFKKELNIPYQVIVYSKTEDLVKPEYDPYNMKENYISTIDDIETYTNYLIDKNLNIEKQKYVALHYDLKYNDGNITGKKIFVNSSDLVTYPFIKEYKSYN